MVAKREGGLHGGPQGMGDGVTWPGTRVAPEFATVQGAVVVIGLNPGNCARGRACQDTSKGGRVYPPLPLQNDGKCLLHGIHFVGLTFHFNEYVLLIPPAARGAAAANHDATI